MIIILPDKSSQEIGESRVAVGDVLARFSINPFEVIVSVNGRVVPEDTVVSGDDKIKVIRIAHGG